MPMPMPRRNEKEDEYISRCMGNDTMVTDFPNSNQRAGVCYSNWRKAKNINPRRSENLSQSTAYSNTISQESDT